MKNEFKAVIFDLDGLLLDTERIAMSMFFTACRRYDYEPGREVYYKCLGGNETTTKDIMLEHFGNDFPWDDINAFWNRIFDETTLTEPIPVKPGVQNLLEYLQDTPVKKAVATSSPTQKARVKLANAGIVHFFDHITGGDNVEKPKPHPDIYLDVCRKLDEEPEKCLALEDSDNGVRSALAAGLSVIQVPDLVSPSPEVRDFGHRIMDSLSDVLNLLQE